MFSPVSQLTVECCLFQKTYVCEHWTKGTRFVFCFCACVKSKNPGSKNTRTTIIEHSLVLMFQKYFITIQKMISYLMKIMYEKKKRVSLQIYRIFIL